MELIKRWIIIFLVIIGIIHSIGFLINTSEVVRSKFDRDLKLKINEKRYTELSKMAYGLGRLWGEAAAVTFSTDDKNKINKIDLEYTAKNILKTRSFDFYCWGPRVDDCGELPTEDDLKRLYNVDYGSKHMPINSFRSGFVDSFVEYIEIELLWKNER